jgi:acetylcholinesterase
MFRYGRTNEILKEYLETIWLPEAPPSDIDQLMIHYPQDPTQGSPYDTGYKNKRLASFQASLHRLG